MTVTDISSSCFSLFLWSKLVKRTTVGSCRLLFLANHWLKTRKSFMVLDGNRCSHHEMLFPVRVYHFFMILRGHYILVLCYDWEIEDHIVKMWIKTGGKSDRKQMEKKRNHDRVRVMSQKCYLRSSFAKSTFSKTTRILWLNLPMKW